MTWYENGELVKFLIEAEKNTWLGKMGNVEPPFLLGAHQYQYKNDFGFYRDIFFGEAVIAGIEIIQSSGEDRPKWSRCYSGGFVRVVNEDLRKKVNEFLRLARRKFLDSLSEGYHRADLSQHVADDNPGLSYLRIQYQRSVEFAGAFHELEKIVYHGALIHILAFDSRLL